MKRLLLPIMALFAVALTTPVFAADLCKEHLTSFHGETREEVEGSLAREMNQFQSLAEHALALRAETIKVGMAIKEKMEKGKPLTGDDIALINTGINEHLAVRKELMAVAENHECWMHPDKKFLKLGVSPETRFKGVLLSLSSALVLYDNYLLAVSLFEGDSKLRRILNERDPGYSVTSAALSNVSLSYNSISNRSRVRKAIKFYENEYPRLKEVVEHDSDAAYLSMLITQSPSYTMVKKWSPLYVISRKIGFLAGITTDTLGGMEREGVSLFSMVFGNAVGLVETRKGKLFRKDEVLTEVRNSLKAGDILLEKTPFRLTDKLIPGYWGHAAMWIGTEDELKDLGIWDNPVVAKYHEEIKAGRMVVEALRSGVEMNTLDHFFNIDSFGALRKPGIEREARARTIVQALRQVGKPYDFNFDVESKERVYCSKLVYLSYSGVEWPTKRSIGRTTFTPDDVAMKAAKDGSLQVVAFYHDGKRVDKDPAGIMAQLMGLTKAKDKQAALQ